VQSDSHFRFVRKVHFLFLDVAEGSGARIGRFTAADQQARGAVCEVIVRAVVSTTPTPVPAVYVCDWLQVK
jgi:hypothetical protein